MTSFSIQFQYILEVKIYKKSWNFRGGSGSDFESPRAPSDAEENTIVFEELPFRPRAPRARFVMQKWSPNEAKIP